VVVVLARWGPIFWVPQVELAGLAYNPLLREVLFSGLVVVVLGRQAKALLLALAVTVVAVTVHQLRVPQLLGLQTRVAVAVRLLTKTLPICLPVRVVQVLSFSPFQLRQQLHFLAVSHRVQRLLA